MLPARPAPRVRAAWSLRSRSTRRVIYQVLVLALLAALVAWMVTNTLTNMRARGIQSGFDFLLQTAGFDIGESPIAFESTDPYWRAFLVGLLNTLRVAVLGIVLTTILGVLLGVGRFSRNALVRGICYAYVEVFRNIPILIQLLLWYIFMVEVLPDPQEPLVLWNMFFLSKGGLAVPMLTAAGWDIPRPGGFGVEGGWSLSPEFLTVLLGLTLYTASFVAEVVRAGIASVGQGQVEAAESIGLSRGLILRLVVLPQALRVIIPPMTNQYLNLTKNSSLAVAVGYPDIVSIANTSLNQTGRAVECIIVIMGVYLTTSLVTSLVMNIYNRRVAIRER
ncbi:MAG: ABC transporter permease subunit [Comamonadaceae bacterium]|nr:MAG: ABC transporter permease subunit [Comamonadaceae bacterium]